MTAESRNCQNCKLDFSIEPEDFVFYEKIKVPPPTFCPECRLQRRMSWRNERSLYRRHCNVPGHTEEIITMYNPDRGHVIYDTEFWWSDAWDPLDYGKEYDFSKSFFIQFSELLRRTPLAALSTLNSIQSEYTNFVDGNKNCYLLFGAGWNENVSYGNKTMSCKDSQDLLMCTKCELSYECEGCVESHHIMWCKNSKNCSDSYFLYNCRNCTNCFACADLVNKSYCIFNIQYTKDTYFKELERLNILSFKNLKDLKNQYFLDIYLPAIHRFANVFSSVDCTGDNIFNSKNAQNCFDLFRNVENCKYLYSALDLRDSYDGNGVFENELSYEYVDCNTGSRNLCTIVVYNSQNVAYSLNCHNCNDCFGCTGLRGKQYCILNKQYTKEEYFETRSKIVEHMSSLSYSDRKGRKYIYGDFFPVELSPFLYNETIAQEYFPALKHQAEETGYNLKKKEARNYTIAIETEALPDSLLEVDVSIVEKTIACEHFTHNNHDALCDFACTEAYKIRAEDLQFYQRIKVPLPRLCPNCRHYSRLKQRNPLKLWHRSCMCKEDNHTHIGTCLNEFETSYAPERPEIIYCESCYQKEVL